MKNRALKIAAISIVFLFTLTSFAVMTGSIEHVQAQGTRKEVSVNPSISNYKVSNGTYVKYTLVLLNNTLVKGDLI
ncbi:MAG: hypothetical protein M1138_02970, partial [Candidatus Thermoplasmatota archaeon]|nr:hypothetical protein [Candidatus Thermoplasmatota archaeon]